VRKLLNSCVATVTGALLLVPAVTASAIVGGAPDEGEHPYVGQLLFHVPNVVDPRFEDPGAWFTCTGTLVDPDTVVTSGHCTYDVGSEAQAPADPLHGGTDVWFTVAEAPESLLPASSTFAPNGNEERYETWSALLDASREWSEAEATFTHPDYVQATFFLHDLGVVELSEPIGLKEYGTLPEPRYLDRYAGRAKEQGVFESVGYGLEDSGPKFSLGGNTRKKTDRRLISFRGAYGYRDIAVMFSHAEGGSTDGGICSGDSGGPTFDISDAGVEEQNVIVAVTSFGLNDNCNASGSYRLDQFDDLSFLRNPAGAHSG
jgi:hypothetical protein